MATPACCFAFIGQARQRAGKPAPASPKVELCCRGSVAKPESLACKEPITTLSLGRSMMQLAQGAEIWDAKRFTLSRRLQEAPANHGRVDAMRDLQADGFVAVKRMPKWWIGSSPEEFWKRHPDQMEQPWVDLGMLAELKRRQFPYTCDFLGLFSDGPDTCVVTSLAQLGDLHCWVQDLPQNHLEREKEVLPVAAQLCEAVGLLHELGVAHRDLSLENVLLSKRSHLPGSPVQVKLIDFGMCMTGRMQGSNEHRTPVGKKCYCAPELQVAGVFDAFAADAFSVGVMLYCMMLWDFPWSSTKPGACASLVHAKKVGMAEHLRTRRIDGMLIRSIVSRDFLDLVTCLMELEPTRRMCLGESCMLQEGRKSALDAAWLRAASSSIAGGLAEAGNKDLDADAEGPHDPVVGFVLEI